MKLLKRALTVFAIAAVVCFVSASGFADPPARIARLNYVSGSISFRPGDIDDWSPATINVPLKTGDHLWTDINSQAEVHAGSTAIRLAPQTAFSFLNLDDQTTQIQLTQGTVNIRLRQLQDNETLEIDTPNAAVSLLRPGVYRVNVDALGNTTVVDRLGESEVTALGSAFTVHPQETAAIMGTDTPTFDIQPALPPDSWDNWCSSRDRREEQAVSTRYVSREMVGYEDLDQYGVWRSVPEYGYVWVPSAVPPGWAPYRSGHWMWVEPWGWTWVDDMPWGFAPFHYGRWAYMQTSWVWIPGRVVARPVYAPALVAFVGGSNWSVSLRIGGGGVAWFPLGPHEAYVPAYRASNTYVQNINVTHVNVTNINVTNVKVVNNTYVNRNVPGAMTAVPQAAFVKAQPVSQAAVTVPPQTAAAAPVTGMTAAVAPQRESLAAKPATVTPVARPPAQVLSRQVVAKNTPPPPPVSFAARQSALAANPGQPLDPAKTASLRQTTPAPAPAVRPAIQPPVSNGRPAPTLQPARPGLQPLRPASAPAPAAAASPAPRPAPAPAPRPNISGNNDRPSTAATPRPAPKPEPRPETKAEPRTEPRPAPRPQEVNPERGRGLAPNRPESERGGRSERPNNEEKSKAKPGEQEKGKEERRPPAQ